MGMVWVQGSGLASRRKPAWRVLGDEVFQAMFLQILEDGLLALLSGGVQGAGDAGTAGAVLHDATCNPEGAFCRFDGVSEHDLSRRPCEVGASAAALFALDQAGTGEAGQDAGKQATRDMRFGGDPVGARPLSEPGKVDQCSQRVTSLAAQLQSQPSVLSLVPIPQFSLIPAITSKIRTVHER